MGVTVLFFVACAAAFAAVLFKRETRPLLGLSVSKSALPNLIVGSVLLLALYLLANLLHLDAASGLLWFVAGLAGQLLLPALGLRHGVSGILLLLAGFYLTWSAPDAAAVQIPALSYLFGLTAGKALNPSSAWEDLALPATWLIGHHWIAAISPESMIQPYQALLAVFLSVSLLMRAIQGTGLLPKSPSVLAPLFVVVTSGLAAWLGVQTLILKPALLNWVWLFTGGTLLSYLLGIGFAQSAQDNGDNTTDSEPSWLQGAIQLVLIGIAALVASRLFGSFGWLVLAVGLLANRSASPAVTVAGGFFLARTLLQGFLYQYNPNVTGINITHPYASAALYEGFAIMLLLPGLLRLLSTSTDTDQNANESNPHALTNTPAWSLLTVSSVLLGGLSNYFLHAEATGSLLVSLTVAGLGVGLLEKIQPAQTKQYPLLLTLLTINSALLSHELLDLGNEADKMQKLTVLGITLVVLLLLVLFSQKIGSGRKPVQVS